MDSLEKVCKQVLELDERTSTLDEQWAHEIKDNVNALILEIRRLEWLSQSERKNSNLLARACQRMKEALEKIKDTAEDNLIAAIAEDALTPMTFVPSADVEKMFGGGRGNVL